MSKKLISLILIIVLLFSFVSLAQGEEASTETTDTNKEDKQEEMKVIDTGIDPLLVIDEVEVDEEVAVGKEFYVKFVVRNMGTGTAFFPKFYFEEDDEDNLKNYSIVNPGESPNSFDPNIREIKSKEIRTITVKMKAKENIVEKESRIDVQLKSQNAQLSDSKYFETNTNFKLKPKYSLTKPLFVVKAVQFAPKKPDLTEAFKATIFFENISETNAHNVSVSLDGSVDDKKNFTILDLSNTKHLFDIKGKQTRMVTFELEAEEPRDGNEIKLTFKYDYSGSSETVTQEEMINLPLPREDIGASGKIPWVIIKKYTLSAEQILAGNTVILSLHIENTNNKDVYNTKVSIVDVQLEDNKKGDTVFSPVDSSNTFYIEKIPGKTTVTKEIALYVDPNAQAKTYNVPIEMTYEYDNGETKTVNERVNIPVTQECKFEVLSVDAPSVASVGRPVPVTAEFVNVGKVALTNFMVNMEGDFQKENAVYYIGNLETGMSDFYQAMVIPREKGELAGKLVFTYIDNNNKEVRVEKPFTIKVEDRPEPPPGAEMGPDGKPGVIEGKPGMGRPPMGPDGPQTSWLVKLKNNWKAVLLLIVIIFQAIFIWRLKRKVKENGEFFDV